MRRPRTTILVSMLIPVGLIALGGCSAGDSAESRVAVLGEALPVTDAPMLGAGDALGRGMHDVILARTGGGATYATVTESQDPR